MINSRDNTKRVNKISRKTEVKAKRICYVTLTKTYAAIAEEIEQTGGDLENFYFIDLTTSYLFKKTPLLVLIKSLIPK